MHPMNGEGHSEETLLPVAHITDCPTITVPCQKTLQGTNRFGSHYIITQVLNLPKN